ncbi:MAG: glycosyltransferase family 39 protein [Acidimicrobiales bacterium]
MSRSTISLLEETVDLPLLTDFDIPPPPVQKRQAFSSSRYVLAAALVLTATTRLVYLASNRVLFSADEATTGLMVRQILHGHFYVFYAGQNYGGTMEQYLEALMYLVLRLPQNPFTLRLPLVALSVVTCYLVYLFAKRLLGPQRAALASVLFAVLPWYNIVGTTTSLGFYVLAQMLGVAALYFALRVGDSGGTNAKWNFIFGLTCGLAIWTSLTCVVEVVPAILWVAALVIRKPRSAGVIVSGIAIGGAPQWICSIASGHVPIPGQPHRSSAVSERLSNLFGPITREYLGLTYNYARGGLPTWLQVLIELSFFGVLGLALFRRRRGILNLLRFRTENRSPADMLLLIFGMVVLTFALSSSTWFIGQPRYILSTYPALMIGLAAACPRRPTKKLGAIVAVILALWLTLTFSYFVNVVPTPTTATRDSTLQHVAQVLVSDHETYVYGGYWTAMPLQYFAGNRLHVAVCFGAERFKPTQLQVDARRHPVYIGSTLDGSNRDIRRALGLHHIHYRVRSIGFIWIYYHLGPSAKPTRIGL